MVWWDVQQLIHIKEELKDQNMYSAFRKLHLAKPKGIFLQLLHDYESGLSEGSNYIKEEYHSL